MIQKKTFLRKTGSADLSSAALSLKTDFSGGFKVCQILLKADANITEMVTVTFNSKDGSSYDVLLNSVALSAEANYVFRPTGECICMDGDQITLACTKANGTGKVYGTIIAEPTGKQS